MRMGIKSGRVQEFVSIISLLVSMQLMKLYYEVQSMKLLLSNQIFEMRIIQRLFLDFESIHARMQ